MKKFAREIPEEEILQKVFAKLPWGHIIALLDKVKSESERACRRGIFPARHDEADGRERVPADA